MTARALATRESILDLATILLRRHGYSQTSLDTIARPLELTKGGLFHHFPTKGALAVAALDRWTERSDTMFREAAFNEIADPLERLLSYLDFRASLITGSHESYSCLAGTLAQEVFSDHPVIREACANAISTHAEFVASLIAAAKECHAPAANWSAAELALYTQIVLQGAFVAAKALDDSSIAIRAITQLRHHFQLLFRESAP